MDNEERHNRLETITNSGVPVSEDTMCDFKNAVVELCEKHDVTLLHEDYEGAFQIVSGFDRDLIQWFKRANDPNKKLKGVL